MIRLYAPTDETALIELWETCGLTRPWNDPQKDIARQLDHNPKGLWVAEINGQIIASAMFGYDGHRGNIYYFCIHPNFQKQGLGRKIMTQIEAEFHAMGCPKSHVMVRSTNQAVIKFYKKLGYKVEETSLLGKRLVSDL